jgi:histidinol-phosphate/aromatic aminotransferase/cobyric acid decarboxylase-like protein
VSGPEEVLRVHGDRQVPDGCIDLAVNVLEEPRPAWLDAALRAALDEIGGYPSDDGARTAVALSLGRAAPEVALLNGAAEGFWLLPSVLRPRLAACVRPEFTEGEAALRRAGVPVVGIERSARAGWRLEAAAVPDEADLVLLGRPGNPTGVVDPVEVIASLCRPDRHVVVDEAFVELADGVGSLVDRVGELPGLVVLRSLTKVWALAGLRVGVLVAAPEVVADVEAARQPWPVNRLALAAAEACASAEAAAEAGRRAGRVAADRAVLVAALRAVGGVSVWEGAANYVLVRTPLPDLRERLLDAGFAVRRGDTFPGLDATYLRVAVRTPDVSQALADAITRILATP